jgi:hypothetical protein
MQSLKHLLLRRCHRTIRQAAAAQAVGAAAAEALQVEGSAASTADLQAVDSVAAESARGRALAPPPDLVSIWPLVLLSVIL